MGFPGPDSFRAGSDMCTSPWRMLLQLGQLNDDLKAVNDPSHLHLCHSSCCCPLSLIPFDVVCHVCSDYSNSADNGLCV